MAFIFPSDRGYFKIGNVVLDVPPEEIQVSRHENQQVLQHLRHRHAMKIPTGRSIIRVDLSFRLPVGPRHEELRKLQQLVAMARVTPFVPVYNQFLQDHLPPLGADDIGLAVTTPWGSGIPMAIFGMSIMAGADSIELFDVRMSLVFWNPTPFSGIENEVWKADAADRIGAEAQVYFDRVIDLLTIPDDPSVLRLRWYDIKTYDELVQQYGKTFDDPIIKRRVVDAEDVRTYGERLRIAAEQLQANGEEAIHRAIMKAEGLQGRRILESKTAVTPTVGNVIQNVEFHTNRAPGDPLYDPENPQRAEDTPFQRILKEPSENEIPVVAPPRATTPQYKPAQWKLGDTFGARLHPIKKKVIGHKGQDIKGLPIGAPVYAYKSGVVTRSKWDSDNTDPNKQGGIGVGYGQYIEIRHDDGTYTRYGHLSKREYQELGVRVEQGQKIGEIGSTGGSTGPHLHFEVLTPEGVAIDPAGVVQDWNVLFTPQAPQAPAEPVVEPAAPGLAKPDYVLGEWTQDSSTSHGSTADEVTETRSGFDDNVWEIHEAQYYSKYREQTPREVTGFRYDNTTDLVPQLIRRYYDVYKAGTLEGKRTRNLNLLKNTLGLPTALKSWNNDQTLEDDDLIDYLENVVRTRDLLDIRGESDEGFLTGSGSVNRSYWGRQNLDFAPIVDPAFEKELGKDGWERISHDPRSVNPLFRQTGEPNLIDLSPAAAIDADHSEIVTSVMVAFQNRLTLMPIAGSPYPSIQHLGSVDSDIQISMAGVSKSEQYRSCQAIQRMAHAMDARATKYRAFAYTGKDVFAITEVGIENRLINGIGVGNVILTDFNFYRDPESTNVIRMDLGLSETGIVDEEIRGYYNFSSRALRQRLRRWLVEREWEADIAESMSDGIYVGNLQGIASKLHGLYQMARKAHARNRIRIRGGTGDKAATTVAEGSTTATRPRPLAAPPSFGMVSSPIVYSPTTKAIIQHEGISLLAAMPLVAQRGVYLNLLNRIPDARVYQFAEVPVPTDPEKILGTSLFKTVRDALKLYTGNIDDPELVDASYVGGIAEQFLDGKYGKDILRFMKVYTERAEAAQAKLRGLDQKTALAAIAEEDKSLADLKLRWLELWNEAHFDYYVNHVVDTILLYMTIDFKEYFDRLRSPLAESERNHPGCYRDLFLSQDLDRNPYDWLDEGHRETVSKTLEGLRKFAVDRSTTILQDATEQLRGIEFGRIPIRRSGYQFDLDDKQLNETSIVSKFNQGTEAAKADEVSNEEGPGTIERALSSIADIDPGQFSIRRAFPTFKLFIVEEDNVGTLRAVDEFYSYNAILDWNLIQYKDRPHTLVLTMTNLFNHLDSIVLNDNFSDDQRTRLAYATQEGGQAPVQHTESDGVNTERSLDGAETDIQNLTLRPGVKIVFKAGYENNPDRLDTLFAGRVAEVQSGDVMTLICEDWTAELLGSWDPNIKATPDEVGVIESFLFDHDMDVTGTAGTVEYLRAALSHIQCRHFGHFQVGTRRPFGINAYNYEAQDHFRKLTAAGVQSGNRSMENIRPSLVPFLNAFGSNYKMVEVEVENRAVWEVIQELRMRHPNNIAIVRPYGQGDATLYFGPTWGRYISEEYVANAGTISDALLEDIRLEAFRSILERNGKIRLNWWNIRENGSTTSPGFLNIATVAFWRLHQFLEGKNNKTANPIPVIDILNNHKFREYLREVGEIATDSDPDYSAYGLRIDPNNLDKPIVKILFKQLQQAAALGAPQANQQGVFDGNPDLNQEAADVVRMVLAFIEQETHRFILERESEFNALSDPETTGDAQTRAAYRALADMTKPVRQWHLVNSRHHIIANNMVLSNQYFNRVVVGKAGEEGDVQYDPGLLDLRTRHYGQYASGDEVAHGMVAVSLLREEISKMYRGEILLVGNPRIKPHDVLMLFDEIRQIYGVVEVDKVVHSMNTENGFITVVTPALLTEAMDSTWAHAAQSMHASLTLSIETFSEEGERLHQLWSKVLQLSEDTRVKRIVAGTTAGAGAVGAGVGAYGALAGTGSALGGSVGAGVLANPVGLVVGSIAAMYLGYTYFSYQNNVVKDYYKSHPITITPLVKKGMPWIAGLDGADGRTAIAQMGSNMVRNIKSLEELVELTAKITGAIKTYRDVSRQIEELENP